MSELMTFREVRERLLSRLDAEHEKLRALLATSDFKNPKWDPAHPPLAAMNAIICQVCQLNEVQANAGSIDVSGPTTEGGK